jgi:hypothetical protein
MRRSLLLLLATLAATPALRLHGQAPEQKLVAFEVASIKLAISSSAVQGGPTATRSTSSPG